MNFWTFLDRLTGCRIWWVCSLSEITRMRRNGISVRLCACKDHDCYRGAAVHD